MGSSPILDFAKGLTHWGSVLAVFLGLVILIWVVLRQLATRWQKTSGALATDLRQAIDTLARERAQAQDEAAQFPPDAPPPYAEPARQLHAKLTRAETRCARVDQALADLEARSAALPDAAWRQVAFVLWQEPRFWRQQLTSLRAVDAAIPEIRDQISAAHTLLRELRGQPLQLSRKARALHQATAHALDEMVALKTAGVHGTTLDTTETTLRAAMKTLAGYPAYLLTGTDSQIIRRADLATTAEVWDSLAALGPQIDEQVALVTAWRGTLAELQSALDEMCETVAAATTALVDANPELDLTAEREAWRETSQRSETLWKDCTAPTVEDFASLNTMRKIADEANAFMARLASLEALRTTLEASLDQSDGRLDQAELQLRQLSEATRYPLDRVPLQAELDRLRRQAAQIRGESPSRTPRQLERDLASAQVLGQKARGFVAELGTIREDRRRMIELLDHRLPIQGDTASRVDWMAWAEDLDERTADYAPANWLPGSRTSSPGTETGQSGTTRVDLRVPDILDDARALAERQKAWVPAHMDEPLSPLTLAKRVTELGSLITDIEAFLDRLGQVTRQLQQLQHVAERATADLKRAYEAIEALDGIAEQVLPPPLARENNHWTGIREQLDAGYTLGVILADPGSGAIRDRVVELGDWLQACHGILSDWHRVLDQEMRETRAGLKATLEELWTTAPLDEETAVRDAHLALEGDPVAASRRPDTAASASGSEGQSREAQIVAQLAGETGALLQGLAGLDRAATKLHAEVVSPLAQPVDRWRDARARAEEALATLQRLEVRSGRLWPPVSCDLQTVQAQMRAADQACAALRQDGKTVRRVVDAVTSLAWTYAQIEAAAVERERVYKTLRPILDETLQRLDGWCAGLEDYRKRHQDDPTVVAAVRARLDEIEASWNHLQVQYDRAPDLIPGDQARRDLDTLWRQAHRDLPVGAGINIIPTDWISNR